MTKEELQKDIESQFPNKSFEWSDIIYDPYTFRPFFGLKIDGIVCPVKLRIVVLDESAIGPELKEYTQMIINDIKAWLENK